MICYDAFINFDIFPCSSIVSMSSFLRWKIQPKRYMTGTVAPTIRRVIPMSILDSIVKNPATAIAVKMRFGKQLNPFRILINCATLSDLLIKIQPLLWYFITSASSEFNFTPPLWLIGKTTHESIVAHKSHFLTMEQIATSKHSHKHVFSFRRSTPKYVLGLIRSFGMLHGMMGKFVEALRFVGCTFLLGATLSYSSLREVYSARRGGCFPCTCTIGD